jgi:thiopurine S-methyltransferase
VSHFSALKTNSGSRIFVPLCGKSLDIGWLLDQGCKVVAIELHEMAVRQLFESLELKPEMKQMGSHVCYSAESIDVFVGDFFSLTSEQLGTVDAIFDRASLVALPDNMRIQYTQHLANISRNASQLLVVFEYDQNEMAGPPFSLSLEEIRRHYNDIYSISVLGSVDVSGQLRGEFKAQENCYLLLSNH